MHFLPSGNTEMRSRWCHNIILSLSELILFDFLSNKHNCSLQKGLSYTVDCKVVHCMLLERHCLHISGCTHDILSRSFRLSKYPNHQTFQLLTHNTMSCDQKCSALKYGLLFYVNTTPNTTDICMSLRQCLLTMFTRELC